MREPHIHDGKHNLLSMFLAELNFNVHGHNKSTCNSYHA